MPQNPITVTLPASTRVFITAFSNSANMHQVNIDGPNDGTVAMFASSQDSYDVMGKHTFTTDAASGGGHTVDYTVQIQNSSDGGQQWVNSQLTTVGELGFYTYHLRVVSSGDTSDNSFDDCMVQFNWFTSS